MAADSINEDDLYGDLNLESAVPRKQQKTAVSSSSEPIDSSLPIHPEISKLQQQIKTLEDENEILKKNMGILYRTAKTELERKDRRIDELQNDLDARSWKFSFGDCRRHQIQRTAHTVTPFWYQKSRMVGNS